MWGGGGEGYLCTSQNAESVGNAQSRWVMDGGVSKTVDLSTDIKFVVGKNEFSPRVRR